MQFQNKQNYIDLSENDKPKSSNQKKRPKANNKFESILKKFHQKIEDINEEHKYCQRNNNKINYNNKYTNKINSLIGNKRKNNSNIEYPSNNYSNKPSSINTNSNNNYTSSKINFPINEDDLFKKNLPIYSFKNEIMENIEKNRVIIISGNTGCGKSTQVPQYIYHSNTKNTILMTQPRRIAAVSISKRLAEEMGEKVGEKIGFHVSMNPNFCKDTRILVETTGIFMEELIHKNMDFSHIILDEVHERDIYVDLVLALIKWNFETNPNSKTKLILMSATIAEKSFADYLRKINGGEVPIIKIKESLHKVNQFTLESIFKSIKEDKLISDKLKQEVESVVQVCLSQVKSEPIFMTDLFPVVAAILEKIENQEKNNKKGVLIFIPGIGEIQDLEDYLSKYFINKKNLEFLILHSQISDIEQDRIFKNDDDKRKIILATNIAESSITISNIDFVIDFCLVKQTKFDETQNIQLLELKWCSKASCQQRKGRTGRVNSGFYFQLITQKLSQTLDDHPKPEILRTTLETPILKLKIYEPNMEPSIILLKTINPPKEGIILRTIFNLEKMGALIKGNLREINTEKGKKKYYKSGIITKVGRIFAELPIDIKYSRLIMISYALGEIELGITLAAILSQDKSIFLNSDKCNRYSLYKAKNFYCFNKQCDFIASYIAYKKWYYEYGHELVNKNISFDTQLKYIKRERYIDMKKYAKNNVLNIHVLIEVLKVENDLKKRLAKFQLYSIYFDSYKNPKLIVNLNEEENVFLLKIILTGAFYNNIFMPEYENTRNIENNILDAKNSENQIELRTIRISDISEENARKLTEIFEAIADPDQIIDDQYYESSESYKLIFDKIEPVKKILFVTSSSIKKNKEIPIFCFQNESTNKDTNKNSKNEEDHNDLFISLSREPEYFYRLRYFEEWSKENIILDKDSVNFIQIIPDLEKLRNCKLVSDNFRGKFSRNHNYTKSAKYSSVLPNIENFDKLMMLVFAPKYEMVGLIDEKTGKFLKYKGFQSHEFTGLSEFSKIDINDIRFNYERAVLIKFDYLITNYHLNIINEIRVLINDIMKFKFSTENKIEGKNESQAEDENDTNKIKFDELLIEYKNKTKKIIEKIKFLLNIKKIRNISNENYQELYDYINEKKYKHKMLNNLNNKISSIDFESSSYDNLSEYSLENLENENEENNEKGEPESLQLYQGYINSIYDLQKKVQPDDFLQIHEPLNIENEYIFTDKKTLIKIKRRNYKIENLYNNFVKDLKKMENLIALKYGYLLCASCHSEICEIKERIPVLTNQKIGEHIIESTWMNDSLKKVYNENNKIEKSLDLDEKELRKFIEDLKESEVKYDNLLSCNSGKHVIGYMRDNNKFIYYGSNIIVKYPDLSYENIKDKDSFINDFKEERKKIFEIMEEKCKPEFKNEIFCKLCEFHIENDLSEFKCHLKTKEHEEKMKELRREFI